jgi:hypothetical protein
VGHTNSSEPSVGTVSWCAEPPGSRSRSRSLSGWARPRTSVLPGGGRRCLGIPVHLLARAKCSRVLENRGRALKPFSGFRLIVSVERAAHHKTWLSLAVIQSQRWTLANTDDLGRTRMDDPPTVLKTAGHASATVHRRPQSIEPEGQDSTAVRRYPRSSAGLAVILAVNDRPGVWGGKSQSAEPGRTFALLQAVQPARRTPNNAPGAQGCRGAIFVPGRIQGGRLNTHRSDPGPA